METDRKNHWETVYQTKNPNEVSWTQKVPLTSLDFIASFHLEKSAKIIDIGGGDSNLVDCLLELGYENLSVLDISGKALDKAKARLGEKASKVNWIVSDILEFDPTETFDVWHDRAAFHFLTSDEEIRTYAGIAKKAVSRFMAIGTFSENGPKKCSGLEISQYDAEGLSLVLADDFEQIECLTEDHVTPFDTIQNFTFCRFARKI
ncbi:class I SAM-dependent methyltransferase [Flavobacterium sp.]|uniref:class I SAM-dependent methyltransferase n=1 Tax=Flavobacterium sp. TaxID=239 RepID=UPI0025BDE7B4|nr:class I SAM-dependent methyltransferase [Flavobacterium sp.]